LHSPRDLFAELVCVHALPNAAVTRSLPVVRAWPAA
jgi:hypothetical protein